MEQPINPQQFNQSGRAQKSKKFIRFSVVSTIFLVGVVIALYIYQIRSAGQNTQATPGITTKIENEQPIQMPVNKGSEKIIYKVGNDLILYNPSTKERSVILNSA